MGYHRTAAYGLSFLLCALVLAGCANPYEVRYEPNLAVAKADVRPPEAPTRFRLGTDAVLDSIDMRDQGYALLGKAYFNRDGRPVMEEQARAAGAAEVLLYRRYEYRDDEPGGIGLGVGVGLSSGSIGYRTGTYSGYGTEREFPDPAPQHRYMATYWARAAQAEAPSPR